MFPAVAVKGQAETLGQQRLHHGGHLVGGGAGRQLGVNVVPVTGDPAGTGNLERFHLVRLLDEIGERNHRRIYARAVHLDSGAALGFVGTLEADRPGGFH